MNKIFTRIECNLELEVVEGKVESVSDVKSIMASDTKVYVSEDCINWTLIDDPTISAMLTMTVNGILESYTGDLGL